MTLLHGPRSGDLVRARRRHRLPAGPPERRLHPHPGLQHGRGAPGRLPLGDEGARARREGHPRRPALRPHERDGRPARRRSAPARDIAFLGGLIRHVLETRVATSRSTSCTTRTPRRSSRGLPGHRGPRRPLLAASTPRPARTTATTWMYEGGEIAASAGVREHAAQSFEERTGAGMMTGAVDARRDAAAPALRAAGPAAPLRPLHAGDGRAHLRHLARRTSSRVADTLDRELGPRAHHGALLRRRLDAAHRRRADDPRRRDPPAAARQHRPPGRRHHGACAATRRSRARPTSRRSTTCCPATCTCPRRARSELDARATTRRRRRRARGWWSHFDKYIVSPAQGLVRRRRDARRTTTASAHLPKITGNHSHFPTMLRAIDGGARRASSSWARTRPSARSTRGCSGARWPSSSGSSCATSPRSRSATFWHDSPEVAYGELRTEDIQTEVFLMPAASHVEKEGTFTNTQRLLQWRDKALDPPGDARSRAVVHAPPDQARARRTTRRRDETRDWPIRNLTWDYAEHGRARRARRRGRAAGDQRLRRRDRRAAAGLRRSSRPTAPPRAAAGSTRASTRDGVNQARRRDPGDLDAPGGWVSPEWGVGVAGEPPHALQPRVRRPGGQAVVGAQALRLVGRGAGAWTGYDVPDFPVDKRPDYRARRRREGMDAISGDDPFIMMRRRPRLAVRAGGAARRPDADALRADRVAGRQPAVPRRPDDATRRRCAGRGRQPVPRRPATRATRSSRRPSA